MDKKAWDKLEKEYLDSVPAKIERIKGFINALKKKWDKETLTALRFDVHKLGGNGGVYSFMSVSALCKELEPELVALLEKFPQGPSDPQFFSRLDTFLHNIKQGFSHKTPISTLIIVDDDEDLLKMLTIAFTAEQYSVITFASGKTAVEDLTQSKILSSADLLILDRLLPDMDGIEILKAIEKKFPSHCPVLFLSMLSAETDVLSGLKEGAIDYITKPFSLDILMQKARTLIRKAKE